MAEQIDKYLDNIDKTLKRIRNGEESDWPLPQKVEVDIKVIEDW